MSGSDLYERFLALHTRQDGFVMPNAWDGVSAQLFADAGFEARRRCRLATTGRHRQRDHGDGLRTHERADHTRTGLSRTGTDRLTFAHSPIH
jgi:hypothetical protein